MKSTTVIVAALIALTAPALARDGNRLLQEYRIPSEGSAFDYVNFLDGKVFIGHRKEGLQVLDLAHPEKVVTVASTAGSNGATFAPELDLGFSGNEDGVMTVFKLSDLSVVETIKVGEEADSTRYDPVTKRVIVFGVPGKTKDASVAPVYQMPGRERVGDIESDSRKLENSAADGAGGVYVAAQDLDAVERIDMTTLKVTSKFSVPCKQPTGIAYDQADKRIFVGCRGGFTDPMFLALNAETGAVVFQTPASPGNDGLVYDPGRKRVYMTNGIGAHLVVIEQTDPDHYAINEVIGTRPMAKTAALDPVSGHVFSITAEPFYDAAKKHLAAIAPFYPNGYVKDTFRVLEFGR